MVAGRHRSRGRTLPAGLCVMAALLLLAVLSGSASASPRPEPPSVAALERATRHLLARPAYRASPRALRSGGTGGTGTGADPVDPPAPASGELFPANRVLSLYGAPQLGSTVLGRRSPAGAARLAVRQAAPYERLGDRPVIPSLDLIGVVANSTRGGDGLYRTRQPDALIAQYLEAARSVGGRLMIDIQPGRSPVLEEIDALEEWIAEPDVDVAIDPEWNVGRRGVPGTTPGTLTARDLNAASRRIARITAANALPPKLLVVHQFSDRSVRRRGTVKQRPGVAVTLNFDGIGAVAPKIAGYESLSTDGLFNGFSLFLSLDTPLMKPAAVLALEPETDFLLYQ